MGKIKITATSLCHNDTHVSCNGERMQWLVGADIRINGKAPGITSSVTLASALTELDIVARVGNRIVRIVSDDGFPGTTTVTDVDSGKKIVGINDIYVSMSVSGTHHATLQYDDLTHLRNILSIKEDEVWVSDFVAGNL